MDKETLSNYGWIVICVLVLAVMLAFATPFGKFVATAVQSTTKGLFDVNRNALDSAGIEIMQQEFEEMLNGENADSAFNPTGVIPEGGTYYVGVTNTMIGYYSGYSDELNAGATFPTTPQTGDVYVYGDYEYRYNFNRTTSSWSENESQNGWGVSAINTSKTSYGAVLNSVNGVPVVNLTYAFYGCTQLIDTPDLSHCTNVTNMKHTFGSCRALQSITNIPSSVINMESTFSWCDSLVDASNIVIPSGVTNMKGTFASCTSLESAPIMNNANSVTDMKNTFQDCTSLVTVPTIPSSVTNMSGTFYGCTSLTGTISVPCNITISSWTYCPVTVGQFHYTNCGH